MARVDLLRRGALFQQQQRLLRVLVDHAIADEAVADTRDHGRLADAPRQRQHRRQHIGPRLLRAHHFQQLHDVGGAEEMHAEHVARALRERRDPVDVERRGVGGENRATLHHLVERLEHGLLDGEVLEHGLDDQVRLRSRGIVERRRDEAGALRGVVGLQFSLGHRAFVLLADSGDAAIQRFLFRFENGHGNAGIREIHGDAAAHGAGADDRDRGNLPLRGLVGEARHFRCRALGEERMAQRLRFVAHHELAKHLLLGRDTRIELLRDGGADRLRARAPARRDRATRRRRRFSRTAERLRPADVCKADRARAGSAWRP